MTAKDNKKTSDGASSTKSTNVTTVAKPKRRYSKIEFVPTQQQRLFVSAMVGCRMSWDEIAAVIVNEATGKRISKHTLQRHFGHELEHGAELLKSTIIKGFYQTLQCDDPHVRWRSVEWGLKNILGYRDDMPAVAVGVQNSSNDFKISFIMPDKKVLEMEALEERDWDSRPQQSRPLPPRQIEHVSNRHDSRRIDPRRVEMGADTAPTRARPSTVSLRDLLPTTDEPPTNWPNTDTKSWMK